jgi:adenine phosphoribosyltransferase
VKVLDHQSREFLNSSIRDIEDFPKEGIVFKDITTLLNNTKAYQMVIDHLEARYKEYNLDYIAGIDARGFIFGAAVADRLKIGFVPVRKSGKLPYTTIGEKYTLEYGIDEVEIHIDAFSAKQNARVLLIDDLIATGGTANAAVNLINRSGAICVESCFIIELKFLKARCKLDSNVYSVIEVD